MKFMITLSEWTFIVSVAVDVLVHSVFGVKHFLPNPDSKVHGANMVPTWVLSASDGPHDGPMDLAIREAI